ncbi:DUF4181 domain-containing protein [Gracilibacillus caseinilyticus]|uniref:DUF4181 domain-containing protein n=1 Tax=Gracilibacillus caseinilyticus TaxID=2932256 RepID=A0ABY4ERK3_9BACI|nr:DUF4181 domain-containing protein [Gracilibacillus caseinilyticus]UOQ47063.1 DUF4181 domain-containing protein [Gracilibacillus caseinilyticus]
MKFLYLFLILIGVMFFEKISNKLLGIKPIKIWKNSGGNLDRLGRFIIMFIFLCVLPFLVWNDINMKWYWITYFTVIIGFRAVLEWLYVRETKQYRTTILSLVVGIILFINLDYFIPGVY